MRKGYSTGPLRTTGEVGLGDCLHAGTFGLQGLMFRLGGDSLELLLVTMTSLWRPFSSRVELRQQRRSSPPLLLLVLKVSPVVWDRELLLVACGAEGILDRVWRVTALLTAEAPLASGVARAAGHRGSG